ncbi:LPXTG cell wall anchor domain-containing protein [Babesia caballi]|uniref:LPXTG cell wall anchor domain-containing protein n=1 Tax=Babesia caballi TaxID=5871 RepID=A0AAV4LXU0_BABCB|nr:LPXTG cell wall anchor domain-containing protein [Babesia caballi]
MEEFEPVCCRAGEAESDSDCCSCDTCSCDSDCSCGSGSESDLSSCSCSPRRDAERDERYLNELDQIKTFIADIAELLRQAKEVPAAKPSAVQEDRVPEREVVVLPREETIQQPEVVVLPQEEPEPEREVQETAQGDEKQELEVETPLEANVEANVEAPVESSEVALEREIAHFEQIINDSETALKHGCALWADGPPAATGYGHTSVPTESPCPDGESTTMANPAYYCYTNDSTVVGGCSQAPSPYAAGGYPTWRSGFDAYAEEQWEDDDYEAEEDADLERLHARMVALDLRSYMRLVETVLDERVRMEVDSY